MSPVFPSHKNLMFLIMHTKFVILPTVAENTYRSGTDIMYISSFLMISLSVVSLFHHVPKEY